MLTHLTPQPSDRRTIPGPSPLRPTPLWQAYAELNRYAWSTPCPIIRANDKMFCHSVLTIKPWRLFGFDRFTMYTKAKLRQLIRNYLPEPETQFELARQRIQTRMAKGGRIDQFMSVGLRIGTGLKDKVKKTGECISGMTFHMIPEKYTKLSQPAIDVQVFFRVSEITMRLLGDFMFIDYIIRHVLEPLGYMKYLNVVTLYLTSYYALVPEFLFWERMYPPARSELDMDNDTFPRAHWERMLSIIKTGINPKSGTPTNYIAFQKKSKRVNKLKGINPLFMKRDNEVLLRDEYRDYTGPLEP
jgi:hypothetical protein